jgi:UDP-N-acetylmuramate: L-alanyl-gamma-D-glutamyl-meso-diaminopimelate ligase
VATDLHILGICGTFMGGVAILARQLGLRVRGSDQNVYPPMSDQLRSLGIELFEGYRPEHLRPAPGRVVVGNALSRGNPSIEYMLDGGLSYVSGPQWLCENVLRDRWVLAVAGTHGKTSTASMLAWILDHAGLDPGFLIGGIPTGFGVSARLGTGPFFVVEADEYDTAFFDKRSKFVHYRPRTLVLNNLEFDHADVFADLGAIQQQFHNLVRIVPGSGLIVVRAGDANLSAVLEKGCWTPIERFVAPDESPAEGDLQAPLWSTRELSADASVFSVYWGGEKVGRVSWNQLGAHSVANALAAMAAARHAGVSASQGVVGLASFSGVKRRLEVLGGAGGVLVYDDFAHHPTAIATTLNALRASVGEARIVAILEPRSNTMRMGVHKDHLAASLAAADEVFLYEPPGLQWDLAQVARTLGDCARVSSSIEQIIAGVTELACPGDHVLIMSNGGFGGIHQRLLEALRERLESA